MEEPFVEAEILTPKEFVGNIMEICQNRRGIYKDMKYLDENRVTIIYELPLNEIIYDFFDKFPLYFLQIPLELIFLPLQKVLPYS